MKIPNSPFSTRLSGSAKETELRIRNIFQWKKKRPPVIALAVAVLVVVFCGSLIGFSNTPRNGTLGEVYQEYFAENPTNEIGYDNKDAMGYPSLDPESENFGAALEYIRSMELRSVLGGKKYIGDFNSRDGAISLRGTNGQGLEIDMYPAAGYVIISQGTDGLVPSGEDARVYQWDESFDVELFLSYLASKLPEEDLADDTIAEDAVQESVPVSSATPLDLSQEPPLSEADYALAVPDFLTEEQQLLYRKARNLYEHIFGADTSAVEYDPTPVSAEYKTLERNGYTYISSNGRYSAWNTFDAVVHSVFTDDFFQSKNAVPLYMEQDGDLYFLPAGRGCGYFYNDNFPDEFRLISQTDTAIEFVVIGHYSEVWPKEGETSEENEQRLKHEYEYTYEFPVTMVLTQDGWRFDQFYSPLTDEVGPELGAAQAEEMSGYERNGRLATIDGISHMPLDELPQEVLGSLTLVSETDLSGMYNAEWGWRRTYAAPGLEITTTAPSSAYLEWREEVDKNNREMFPSEEDFYAYIEGEEGREWLVNVTITDDKYATLDGLKVGMTCTQAEALGYSLHDGENQIGNVETELKITVENDTVVQMRTWWTMGRYIGKFFEL